MFGSNTTSEDRGQVGIGTLIVFIAMVLVAAIAAGVLINTAGFLQAQAEATGEESSEQVSDRVEVVSVIGHDDGPEFTNDEGGEIDELEISVRRAAGAGDIDLTNVVIEAFANGESATLTNSDFNIVDIQGAGDDTLSSSDDRAALHVDLESDVDTLAEGETVTVSITTAAGGTSFVEKRAPSTITNGESYRL